MQRRTIALGLALAATVVAGAVVIGPTRRQNTPPPRLRVVERLATPQGVVPFEPVHAASKSPQRWLAADIENTWTRVGTGAQRTYRSPSLTLAAGELVAIVATFPPAPADATPLLIWSNAPTLSPEDFARNRHALAPSADGAVLVLRREVVESGAQPLQHLFIHLPAGHALASSLTSLSLLRHADVTREGPVGPLRVTKSGETRDAILGAAGHPLSYSLTKPAESVSFGVHIDQSAPLTVRVRHRRGDHDAEVLVAPISRPGWHDLTAKLIESAPSTIVVEVTGVPGGVTVSTPVALGTDFEGKPHIVLYVADALRADALGKTGGPHPTPVLDGLGGAGAVFDRTYASASWTKPSIATLLTSLYPSTYGIGSRYHSDPLPDSVPTIQSTLAAAGYRTAQFSGNPFTGPLSNLDRGFDVASTIAGLGESVSSSDASAARVHDRALEWLARHREERTFVYVHTVDTHPPFSVRRETPRESHDASVASLDTEIGAFRTRLQALGFEDVLLVVTADHGEAFGEHSRLGHGQSVYEEEVRVPLLLHWPGRIMPGRINEPVHHLDVTPTILSLVNVQAPSGVQGVNLWPFSQSTRPSSVVTTRFVYPDDIEGPVADRDGARALIDFPWKLIVTDPPSSARRIELYQLALDPDERQNLAAQELARVRTLSAALEGFDGEQRRARADYIARHERGAAPGRHTPSRDLLDRLRGLGYVR